MNIPFTFTIRFLPLGLLSLVITGCGTGSKSYRPVGASQPANVVIQTKKPAPVSQTSTRTQQSPTTSQQSSSYPQQSSTGTTPKSTETDVHYIRPGQKAPGYRSPSSTQTSRSTPTSGRYSTTREPFNGNRPSSYTINKISKTIAVHCTKQLLSQSFYFNRRNTQREPQTFCTYQFPKHCGNYRFSLIESGAKQILVYHDQQLQLNLLDGISLSNQSKAGVWDLDDYVSSAAKDVSSLFSNDANAKQDRLVGRIIQASARDKQLLATNYLKAVNKTASCF